MSTDVQLPFVHLVVLVDQAIALRVAMLAAVFPCLPRLRSQIVVLVNNGTDFPLGLSWINSMDEPREPERA